MPSLRRTVKGALIAFAGFAAPDRRLRCSWETTRRKQTLPPASEERAPGQCLKPGGFHQHGKALTIVNKGSATISRGPHRTQNRVPAQVEGPNIIYGVGKAAPTACAEKAHPPGIASSKEGR